MQLEHHFTVPVPPDVAWEALLDPQRVAPCFPGATLQSVDGPEFTGTVKVRLGPVALLYKGKGVFTATDTEARRTTIEASAKDTRGNGTAAANVAVTVRPDAEGTAVNLTTDLKITGRPAQLGRGLISEVSGKIVTTFADCLAARLTEQRTGESAGSGGSDMTDSANAPRPAAPHPTETARSASAGSAGSAGAGSVGSRSAGSIGSGSVGSGSAGSARSDGSDGSARSVRSSSPEERVGPAGSGEYVGSSKKVGGGPSDASAPSEINLIEVAGPPVLKRVALVMLGGFVLLLILRKLFRRRRLEP
jgi:uncharacterized protein